MPLEEYGPGTAFPGVLGRTTEEPGPAWPAGRRCPPAGARGRDEVDARLWLLGSGDSLSGRRRRCCSGMSWWWQTLRRALLAAKPGEVRCLGKHAAIVVLAVGGGARVGVAASADGRERACGPFAVGGPVR
jgi:hypothetical protein